MANEAIPGRLRDLQPLWAAGTLRDLSDGQLLERFATGSGDGAEAAFRGLVERHGAMVLRVCQSILEEQHDAQDAFQATFLVLLNKARRLWVRDSLGPWLHQVAYRTAANARKERARRRRHEQAAGATRATQVEDRPHTESLAAVLHKEIERLPERYRQAVLLCDLEGQSHEQAAQGLNWPVGTLKSRLARGRQRLRSRLLRQGCTPAGCLAMGGPPALSGELLEATVRMVVSVSLRGRNAAGVPSAVARLAQGVEEMIFWTSVRQILMPTLGASLLLSGGWAAATGRTPAARQDTVAGVHQEKAKEGGDAGAPDNLFEVRRGSLVPQSRSPGRLESGHVENIYSEVEGKTTIVRLVEDGARVKQGDVIAQLDHATQRDLALVEQPVLRSAQAAVERQRMALEVAEIALKEYVDGVVPQELATLDAAIADANAEAASAGRQRDRLEAAQKLMKAALDKRGLDFLSPSDILAQIDLDQRIENNGRRQDQAKLALTQAVDKKRLFEKFTRPKTEKQLQVEIDRAKADMVVAAQAFQLEQSRQKKLEQQIAACQVKAPFDGIVVYSETTGRNAIEEGAQVREHQRLFQIVDMSSPLVVQTKVEEMNVDRFQAGTPAKIAVHAFPGREWTGTVESIAHLPDPTAIFSDKRKLYSTVIRLDAPAPELRRGLTADVVIPLGKRDNVLIVPRDAVRFDRGGWGRVRRKNARGEFEEVKVQIGDMSDEWVEITAGLTPGETVWTRSSQNPSK